MYFLTSVGIKTRFLPPASWKVVSNVQDSVTSETCIAACLVVAEKIYAEKVYMFDRLSQLFLDYTPYRHLIVTHFIEKRWTSSPQHSK